MTVQRNTAAEQPKKQAMEEVTGPRKSMVRVRFPRHGSTLTYYNDRFDLHRGDIVFVEGAREGLRGCVVEVNYNFRIRLSDYKRVIAVADIRVEGKFYQMGSHFVTFDPQVLPAGKAASWYLPPKKAEEYVTGSDGVTYPLEDWERVCVPPEIADRGRRYYVENRVVYLSLAGNEGYAIVEGGRPYEVEFLYHDGEIGELFCNCPCSLHTPLKKCSLTADDGASPPLERFTDSAEMVHGGRERGVPDRHAGNYSGMPLRLRMDSPSIWMV